MLRRVTPHPKVIKDDEEQQPQQQTKKHVRFVDVVRVKYIERCHTPVEERRLFFSCQELQRIHDSCTDLVRKYIAESSSKTRCAGQQGQQQQQHRCHHHNYYIRGLECRIPSVYKTKLDLKRQVWDAVLFHQGHHNQQHSHIGGEGTTTTTTTPTSSCCYFSTKHQLASTYAAKRAYEQGLRDEKIAMKIYNTDNTAE